MIHAEDSASGQELPFDPKSLFLHLERSARSSAEGVGEAAQQLYYDAMEAGTEDEEFELLSEALELDPKNVDAMLAMKRHLPPMLPDAEIEFMQKIVAIAEAGLGRKIFEEMGGHFWGFMETRPYMRARASLADALHAAGRGAEAVSEWEGMLTLNPNDNQGMRYRLLSACLQLGRMDEVRELLGRYPECEFSTVFAWAKVLERFVSGDLNEALEAVAVAQKQNAFAKAYLLGHRRIPKNLPDSYAMGSKEEAACFAQDLQAAWSVYPAARKWLEGLKPKKR